MVAIFQTTLQNPPLRTAPDHTPERRIELAFEGQAGWDLRRWKELQNVLSTPVQGWNVFNRTTAGYYQLSNVFQPIFSLKIPYPIKDCDLLTNPNLVQGDPVPVNHDCYLMPQFFYEICTQYKQIAMAGSG